MKQERQTSKFQNELEDMPAGYANYQRWGSNAFDGKSSEMKRG